MLIKILITLEKYFKNKNKLFIVAIGLFGILAIGIVDNLIVENISLSIFFLAPIIFTTWFANKNYGIFICFASASVWLIAELSSKIVYPSVLIPYWNAGVRLGFFLITCSLLSHLKIAYDREKYWARTDQLTGAYNRRFFLELLQAEINRSKRYKHPLTLAYIDLDNFKQVNDRFGHSTGDRLLKLVAEIATQNIRNTDIFGRLGGDEFVLLMPETSYEAARIVLERVQQSLLKTMAEHSWSVSLSIGATTFIKQLNSSDAMLELADKLMYTVKNSGKNRIEHTLFD